MAENMFWRDLGHGIYALALEYFWKYEGFLYGVCQRGSHRDRIG